MEIWWWWSLISYIHSERIFDRKWYHRSRRWESSLWNIIRISCKILSGNVWKECNWKPRKAEFWGKVNDEETVGAVILFRIDTVVPAIFSFTFNDQFQLAWIGDIAKTFFKLTEFASFRSVGFRRLVSSWETKWSKYIKFSNLY